MIRNHKQDIESDIYSIKECLRYCTEGSYFGSYYVENRLISDYSKNILQSFNVVRLHYDDLNQLLELVRLVNGQ